MHYLPNCLTVVFILKLFIYGGKKKNFGYYFWLVCTFLTMSFVVVVLFVCLMTINFLVLQHLWIIWEIQWFGKYKDTMKSVFLHQYLHAFFFIYIFFKWITLICFEIPWKIKVLSTFENWPLLSVKISEILLVCLETRAYPLNHKHYA